MVPACQGYRQRHCHKENILLPVAPRRANHRLRTGLRSFEPMTIRPPDLQNLRKHMNHGWNLPHRDNFASFLMKLFPIVQDIANRPEHAHHPFIIKWEKLCSATLHKYPMSAMISWRSLKALLGINDIFDYNDFLQQCPEIDEYIKFAPSQSTKNGFDFGIYEHPNHNPEGDILQSSSPSIDSPSTIGTDSYVFDFNEHKPPAKLAEKHQQDPDENSSETRLSRNSHQEPEEPVILTPKQTNVNYLPHIVSVTRTTDTVNNASTTSSIPTRESTVAAEETVAA